MFCKFCRNQDVPIKLIGKCSICPFLCLLKHRKSNILSDQFHTSLILEGNFLFIVNWAKQMWTANSPGPCCLECEAAGLKSTKFSLTRVNSQSILCVFKVDLRLSAVVGNLIICLLFPGSVSKEHCGLWKYLCSLIYSFSPKKAFLGAGRIEMRQETIIYFLTWVVDIRI